jgi:DMSO/TMAO reductase YedYZ heme-binding membrane subunit
MFIIPMIGRWTDWFSFSFYAVPMVGNFVSEFSSFAYIGHALFVIIMYMGAFSTKHKPVARLMSIRKHLSIIVGVPVFAHTLKRIFTAIHAFGFFTDREAYMESPRNVSELAAGISSVVFILGIVMFVLFLVLWITSFDSVRLKMKAGKWKQLQRWSYGLYAMLFIQAFGLQLSSYINQCEREKMAAQTEQVSTTHNVRDERGRDKANITMADAQKRKSRDSKELTQAGKGQQAQAKQASKGEHRHHPKRFSLSEVQLDKKTGSLIRMIILLAVYGSYLFFRIRKAKRDKEKRAKRQK